jgi:1,4-dihydroxy-2-naphthoate octaprenyltransferase
MFRSLLKLSRPIQLLLAMLTYTLGAGINHYLGQQFHAASFGLGLLSLLALLSAATLLDEYFNFPLMPLAQEETFRQRIRFRVILLQVSFAALTLFAIAILTLLLTGSLNMPAAFLVMLIIVLLVIYAVPPMHLSETGYGELILAVTLGTLLPALAFMLQYGQFHRLLTFSTFPLSLLALAYLLVGNFFTYASDQKLGRHSLLTLLTWERAIPIHHFLVLSTFLLFAIEPFLGYPWGLVGPVFLAFPFAIIQIIWLQHIANGGRTFWDFLITLNSTIFGLVAYLLAVALWTR